MNFYTKTLYTSFLTFCFVLPASAQIVNIETKRMELDPDTAGWFGSIDFGMNLNQNGNRVFSFSGNADLEYLQGKNLWIAITNYRSLLIDNQSFVNSGFQHLRYNRRMKNKLTWEIFTQAQYNEQLRIRLRVLAGTGPRFQFLNNKKGQIFIGTLYMFQYEDLHKINIIHRDHRLSAYLRVGLQFSDNFKIYSTSYFQPLLTDFSVVRLSSQTNLSLKITKHLSFSLAFTISGDSRLSKEADVPLATYQLVNGVRWTF